MWLETSISLPPLLITNEIQFRSFFFSLIRNIFKSVMDLQTEGDREGKKQPKAGYQRQRIASIWNFVTKNKKKLLLRAKYSLSLSVIPHVMLITIIIMTRWLNQFQLLFILFYFTLRLIANEPESMLSRLWR